MNLKFHQKYTLPYLDATLIDAIFKDVHMDDRLKRAGGLELLLKRSVPEENLN